MLTQELLNPKSIAIIGASNDVEKPGGKILKNIKQGGFKGALFPVNPKEQEIQDLKCYPDVKDLPEVDCAILAIPARFTLETVEILLKEKKTKGFIILSAGFSEYGEEGKKLERKIARMIDDAGASLIGPNCIGILNTHYNGVFAGPIPKLDENGCDFVSQSGATVVFILEAAIPRGLTFNSIYSVGNSAQIGVEEVLEFWDNTFESKSSSKTKLIYVEQIHNPHKFLKHSRSLINKGCRIAAIKAGTSEAGSRAVSSHTGALAGSDTAVDALFRKAGIVRCYSRVELVYVAGIMQHKELTGKNIAVITHAGGSGVMLTDALQHSGMEVPPIKGPAAEALLSKLFTGSSVSNPIDFLATGTAEQLGIILDYVDNDFDNIDGSVVIFGTTGMFDVTGVYDVLHKKMSELKKPIYPALPSVVQAAKAVNHFLSLGRINFTDEVTLGRALGKVYYTPKPYELSSGVKIDKKAVREVILHAEDGYLPPDKVAALLDAAGIPRVKEKVVKTKEEAVDFWKELNTAVVMKVVGPVHKSDVGGVKLNIFGEKNISDTFDQLMKIEGAESVLIQPMITGREIFAGAKQEPDFGHILVTGLGGIFVEVLKDVAYGLTPLSHDEAEGMIKSVRSFPLIKGVRGQEGVNLEKYTEVLMRLSALVEAAPEIVEMDINPLLGNKDSVTAVDARIKVKPELI